MKCDDCGREGECDVTPGDWGNTITTCTKENRAECDRRIGCLENNLDPDTGNPILYDEVDFS